MHGRALPADRLPELGGAAVGHGAAGLLPSLGNTQAVCLVMIETVEGVANLEEILGVPGVDGVLVGPNDLSISYSGDTRGAASSPRDVEMIVQVGESCRRHGLAAAISADIAHAKRWAAAGFTLIALPSDAAVIGEGLARAVARVNASGDDVT